MGREAGKDACSAPRARVDLLGAAATDRARCEGVPASDDVADEAHLVARLVARDEAAFNALVRAYERRVFALLVRMSGSRAEAEDLAQEVFVQVFKGIGSFRGESKLSTWIYRIAVNLSKNRSKYLRVRKTDRQEQLESLEERAPADETRRANIAPAERPDDMMAGRQLERIVQAAILELEPTFRECLVLRDIEDLSYDEIAAITSLPEGTVKSRIHRARTQLKEIVERALGEKIT
jgi:RNA polymerase sigma-70 factor (ECF subfamily)